MNTIQAIKIDLPWIIDTSRLVNSEYDISNAIVPIVKIDTHKNEFLIQLYVNQTCLLFDHNLALNWKIIVKVSIMRKNRSSIDDSDRNWSLISFEDEGTKIRISLNTEQSEL